MRTKEREMSPGCLSLFGVPFFIAGLFVFYLGISAVLRAYQAEDWLDVPVSVEKLVIETHSGSDSTTYSIETSYTYGFEGKTYRGDRFSFTSGSDNVTDHQALINEFRQRQPPYGFIDPDNPSQSVLYKDVPLTASFLIPFGLVFMIVGLTFIVGGIATSTEKGRSLSRYQSTGQLQASGVTAFLPLAIITGGTSFALVFLNAFVLSNFLNSVTLLKVTVVVLSMAFLYGLVITISKLRNSRISPTPGDVV